MPQQVEVLGLHYPGRQDRRHERCLLTIADLADGAVTALSGWTDRPYAFFGHSMGAILAFEVARRLATPAGAGPAWLFASGRRAPSCQRDATMLHRESDVSLLAELRQLGGTDGRLLDDEEAVAMIMPAARADYEAIETYTYRRGPRLACPITALVGDRDPQCSSAEAAAWATHTAGGFDLRIYAGGHFYLDGHRRVVAHLVADSVAEMLCH